MQGFNIRFKVDRPSQSSDDAIGGSVVTYSTVYSGLKANLQGNLVEDKLAILNRGYETEKIFRVTCQPGNRDIRENDLFVITSPLDNPYYNLDFRILKVNYSNFIPSDSRDYMILTLSLSEEAHLERAVASAVAFSSGEIGDVGQTTVEVIFTDTVSSANYALGVTVKVNGIAVTISSASRQDPQTNLVHYILDTPVDINDTITWEYDSGIGDMIDGSGLIISNVSETPVTNYVGSQFYFDTEESSMWNVVQ